MNGRSSLRYLILVLVFTIAFAVLAWFGIYFNVGEATKTPRVEMLLELSKVLAQLVFVTLIGATISFIYNQHTKEKETNRLRAEENNNLRRELLTSLIAVRAQVEKTRREFRLLPADARSEGYKQSIHSLLEARLNLSQVWHGTETWKELYGEDSQTIQAGLLGMKKFLDPLIDEYEANRAVGDAPLFTTFVTGDGGYCYTDGFLEQNYRNAARMIRKHLLSPEQ